MPASQTAFPTRQDEGQVGSPAKSRYQSDTGVVETAAGIPVGAPVMRGVDPSGQGVALLATGGGVFLGIARLNRGATADRHPQYKPLAYFTAGHVFVLADAAVAIDSVVRYNTATGRYTNAAASATVIECTGWVFDRATTAAGQLTIIKRV